MKLNRLTIVIVSIFVVAITTVIILSSTANYETQVRVRLEVIKHLLQLTVVFVIGGVITGLFKTIDHSRDQAIKKRDDQLRQDKLRAEIHEGYLKKLGALYRAVKSSRRALRAFALTTKHCSPGFLNEVQVETYQREMTKLNESQLELEGMMIESERLPIFVGVGDLENDLHSMEDYLRKILSEYEKYFPRTLSGDQIHFEKLSCLSEFTASTKKKSPEDRFTNAFWWPYDRVIKQLSAAINKTGS